jgi:hypothetical protein
MLVRSQCYSGEASRGTIGPAGSRRSADSASRLAAGRLAAGEESSHLKPGGVRGLGGGCGEPCEVSMGGLDGRQIG